ncbi:MAG TPA: Flp family type IVb pilin [Rhizomicrobium sp.]|nr:Flp family type IVb pilin [Rhizomicrobium sp.]
MGASRKVERICNASGRHPADTHAARFYLTAFLKDCRGATAIEYAMIAAGISVAIITAVGLLGSAVAAKFNLAVSKL